MLQPPQSEGWGVGGFLGWQRRGETFVATNGRVHGGGEQEALSTAELGDISGHGRGENGGEQGGEKAANSDLDMEEAGEGSSGWGLPGEGPTHNWSKMGEAVATATVGLYQP